MTRRRARRLDVTRVSERSKRIEEDMRDRVRIGVVGCGLIAQVMHLHYLTELSDRFELAAVCESIGLDVWAFTALVFALGCGMGIGKAAVYKLIPDHFPNDVGAVGGLVGRALEERGIGRALAFGPAVDLESFEAGLNAPKVKLTAAGAACRMVANRPSKSRPDMRSL